MKKTIILDTNALMAVGQFGIDIFSEIEQGIDFKYSVAVLDKSLEELEKLVDSGKTGRAAKLGLSLIKAKKVKVLKSGAGQADDLLVGKAKKGAIIVTQDRELKRRIKDAGGKVMVIRQKKKMAWG